MLNFSLNRIRCILTASLLLVGSHNIQGSPCCFDGFYVGGSVGGNLLHGRQTGSNLGILGFGDASLIFANDLDAHYFNESLSGEIFAGWGSHFGIFYTGLELFGQYSPIHSNYEHQNSSLEPLANFAEGILVHHDVSIGPWQYGLDIRPGILLTPATLFYARMGIKGARIKFQTTDRHFFVSEGDQLVSVSQSVNKQSHYLHFGLGLDQMIHSHLSLRLEYALTDYRSLRFNSNNSELTEAGILSIAESGKVHLKTSELKLALSYHFSPCCPDYGIEPPCFCGWYVGAGLGGGIGRNKHSFQVLNISPGPESGEETFLPHNFTTQIHQPLFRSMIWGGYSFRFCSLPLFAGVEVFGQYNPQRYRLKAREVSIAEADSDFNANVNLQARTKINPWQYGIQVRPGILLTPSTLLFGTVGMSIADIDAHFEAQFNNQPAPIEAQFSLLVDSHRIRPVLRVGGGIEYDLQCQGWHLRADYLYTNYRSLPIRGNASILTQFLGTLSLSSDSSFHLKDHAITLGITKYL